jgi:MFS transporter, YNFM family, putative membrane transport protein
MALGALTTLSRDVSAIVLGIALLTCGFFGAHTIASSWVGSRARTAKAQAAAIYFFSYYLGSSVSGTMGGLFWSSLGWQGVVALIFTLLAASLCLWKRLVAISEAKAAAGAAVPSVEAVGS